MTITVDQLIDNVSSLLGRKVDYHERKILTKLKTEFEQPFIYATNISTNRRCIININWTAILEYSSQKSTISGIDPQLADTMSVPCSEQQFQTIVKNLTAFLEINLDLELEKQKQKKESN